MMSKGHVILSLTWFLVKILVCMYAFKIKIKNQEVIVLNFSYNTQS